jgi:hypothetical protein
MNRDDALLQQGAHDGKDYGREQKSSQVGCGFSEVSGIHVGKTNRTMARITATTARAMPRTSTTFSPLVHGED